ncbi:glutathione S-transferase U15-like [Silene latifolia]|uniref:glutathione S-transferase U15-like n=1 Tax=Silene latifolia TaxID=37657 RepID=UPI003D784199
MAERNCDVKVLGAWPSPFVMRPRTALNLKSIEYDFIAETMNPIHKKIPVLLLNDKPVCESNLIVEYIDEAFSSGMSILPSDPYDRVVHRFWATYVDDKILTLMETLFRLTQMRNQTSGNMSCRHEAHRYPEDDQFYLDFMIFLVVRILLYSVIIYVSFFCLSRFVLYFLGILTVSTFKFCIYVELLFFT